MFQLPRTTTPWKQGTSASFNASILHISHVRVFEASRRCITLSTRFSPPPMSSTSIETRRFSNRTLTSLSRPDPVNGSLIEGALASEPPPKRRRLENPEHHPGPPRWSSDQVFIDCLTKQVFPHINPAVQQLPKEIVDVVKVGKKVSLSSLPSSSPSPLALLVAPCPAFKHMLICFLSP